MDFRTASFGKGSKKLINEIVKVTHIFTLGNWFDHTSFECIYLQPIYGEPTVHYCSLISTTYNVI